MLAQQMFERLVAHGCTDLSSAVNHSQFSSSMITGGSYGDIWKGKLHDGTDIAIKVWRFISITEDGRKSLKRATREIYNWSKADHENVHTLLGVIMFQGRLGMVSNWMENGNLQEYLSRNKTIDRYRLCTQVANGVQYLHGENIVHGDLKACNVLVSREGVPKLADFDHSILWDCSLTFSQTSRIGGGTVRWMAPELILDDSCQRNKQTDVYALGMTLLEIITGTVPYPQCRADGNVVAKILQKALPNRTKNFSEDERGDRMWALLVKCWDYNPASRPTANDAFDSLRLMGLPTSFPKLNIIPTTHSKPMYPSAAGSINGGYMNSGMSMRGAMSPWPGVNPNPQIMSYVPPPTVEEGKMSVSIDFGTTFSGVAFGSSRIAGGRVQQILQWPGSFENFRKIPTCLLYGEHGEVLAWGMEAKNAPLIPGSIRCEWFKLFLEPKSLREGTVDPRLPGLPPSVKPIDTIIDFLSCLWNYAKQQITREIGAVADLSTADVWLTVPAAWDAKGCDIMREAAIQAGLVHSRITYGQNRNWRDRLRIITELEAAAVHCAYLTDLHQLRPTQNFMICYAGGGTVDLAIYKILGSLERLEIGEVCARIGVNCGSLFLDLRFRDLVARLLERHPAHTDSSSLAYFQDTFSKADKLAFRGEEDDRTPFQFNCFNVEDPDDPTVGLINGELIIPGALLRSEVFDPVIAEVLQLIEDQIARCNQPIHALLLVGGFSGSEYLFKRVDQRFGSRINVIARPADADTATCRGAARYGLANRALVSSVIAPRAYIMKVKLPAEAEDYQRRPTYISRNNAGVHICENRLQYLVQKGAILRKGQRVKTKFCKFSRGPQDSTFVAVLYTSDSERVMRYTDEGETAELCKWTVDLSSLPSFAEHARMGNQNGFYTEFELGLEFDSAEVRGVLLDKGDEWGRVVFEFLN